MDEKTEGEVLHSERQGEGQSEASKCLNRSVVYEISGYCNSTVLDKSKIDTSVIYLQELAANAEQLL
jgi:hypothetical protein